MNTTSNIHHLSARHANSNNPMTIRSSSPSVVLNTAASGVSPATTTVCEGGGIPSDAYMSAASVSSAVDANNALQAAYLALQTQNQLQRQQQLSEMSAYAAFPLLNSSSNAGLSQSLTSAEATERLLAAQASLLAAQSGANISPNSLLSAAALLQQQPPPDAASSSVSVCSSASCSASPSMAVCPAANVAASSRQTSSAFSPIRAIGNPITSTAPSRPTQQYAAPPSSSPSTTTTTTTTTPSLDMMLLQMQMAAAAAGLVQTPFNLLAPSNLNASATNTALVNSLLAPHLRLQQSSATASGLSPSLEAALSNASLTGDCTVSSLAQQLAVAAAVSANPSNVTNQLMTQPQNLFEQSSLNNLSNSSSSSHNRNSMTSLLARPSSSMPGSPSKPNETSPIPLPRCYSMGKQQYHPQHHHQPQPQQQQQQKQFQLKRPHHSISNSNDMAVLRSLCNDTETPEVTPPVKRRTKTIACCDSELDRRLLAAEVMASGLKEMTPSMEHRPRRSGNNTYRFLNDFHHRSGNRKSSNADGALSSSSSYSTTSMSVSNPKVNNNNNIPTTSSSNAECNQQIPSGDPNSPNRHHPLNHQPPAMEARFLECMAAIVLHSDFSIPTTSSPSNTEESNSSASPPNQNDTSDSQRQQQQQLNKYDSLQSPKSATNEAAQSESNERKISDEDVPLEIDQHSPKCPKSDNMQTDDGDDDDDIRIIDDSDLFVIKDDAEKQDQSQENGTKNHKDSKGSTPINQQNDSESGDDIDMEPTDTTTTTTTTTESTQQQQQQQQKLTERLLHKSEKRTWPTTAIDDELCKELENYKGTDVKMIHAYVIPPRSDTSSSSGDSLEDRGQSPPFHSVPSLAVPVPILNILLERILHTMLQT